MDTGPPRATRDTEPVDGASPVEPGRGAPPLEPVDPDRPSLPFVLDRIRDVEGWLTIEQAARLHRAGRSCAPGGQVVEIGSFRGRSTVVLASSVAGDVEIVAIDPHAGNDRGPQEIEGFADEAATDNRVFRANLAAAGVADRVRHIRSFSDRAHDCVDGAVDVLFIDGAHRYVPARNDICDWGRRVRPGGRMLIHDAFSSVGVTAAIATQLVGSRQWRYEGRSGSLVEYRRIDRSPYGALKDAVRQLAQCGWFARNVLIKVLIVARLGRLTRFLGHRQPTWPY